MPRFILLLCLACVLPLMGQSTQVTPSQLKVGTNLVTSGNTTLLGYAFGGSFRIVKQGPGLKLTPNSDGTLTLSIDLSQLRLVMVNETRPLLRNSTGAYEGATPSCAIFRNGLAQNPGVDYTFSGNTVVPNSQYPWSAGDADNPPDTAVAVCPVLVAAP